MKPINNELRIDGFDFELVKRDGLVALFSKTKPSWTQKFYEVVILQERPEHTWPNGKTTPPHEAMPSSEQWGTYGWSYSNIPSAKKRFAETVASTKMP